MQSRDGGIAHPKEHERRDRKRPRVVVRGKRAALSLPIVPSHLLVTDISGIKQETTIFKGLVFHFLNTDQENPKGHLHKLVIQNGGRFAMNLSASVTHIIAAEKRGIQYKAAALGRDVIHVSWFLDCCAQKALVPLRPRYFLHLSKESKGKLPEDIDEFGDNFYEDLDVNDLKQMFTNMDRMHILMSKSEVCRFEDKHFRKEPYGEFCGCIIYFWSLHHIQDEEIQAVAKVALKRLELGLLFRKGEVTKNLKYATHMIVYFSDKHPISLGGILRTLSPADRLIVLKDMLQIVKHTWLEDSLEKKIRLNEDSYNLKNRTEITNIERDFVAEARAEEGQTYEAVKFQTPSPECCREGTDFPDRDEQKEASKLDVMEKSENEKCTGKDQKVAIKRVTDDDLDEQGVLIQRHSEDADVMHDTDMKDTSPSYKLHPEADKSSAKMDAFQQVPDLLYSDHKIQDIQTKESAQKSVDFDAFTSDEYLKKLPAVEAASTLYNIHHQPPSLVRLNEETSGGLEKAERTLQNAPKKKVSYKTLVQKFFDA
ncbi:hypothetical protein KP509_21G026900 [Ceratopteris richardii]|nr:hypothetical protein KP509_21G026900 [Ceratopteris richardii]